MPVEVKRKPSLVDVSCVDFGSLEDLEFTPSKPYLSRNHKGLVFVQGRFANSQTGRLFEKNGYIVTKDIEEADIVCWTGGEDLNPKLYNEPVAGAGGWSDWRDSDDIRAVGLSKDKFKVGLCRGAQLLNVIPNGGKLWQDVDRHEYGHHDVVDTITGEIHKINSIHHQALRLTDKAELVAYARLSTVKYGYDTSWHVDNGEEDPDVEVAYYPETRSLCIQSHPEFDQDGPTGAYFYRLLERYYSAA